MKKLFIVLLFAPIVAFCNIDYKNINDGRHLIKNSVSFPFMAYEVEYNPSDDDGMHAISCLMSDKFGYSVTGNWTIRKNNYFWYYETDLTNGISTVQFFDAKDGIYSIKINAEINGPTPTEAYVECKTIG